METLYGHDRLLAEEGWRDICGVDEAGRGPLAGPVCAAAVILPLGMGAEIAGIHDSKKLTPKKREALFDEIIRRAQAYAIAWAGEGEIDELNILQASLLAMRRAVEGLGIVPGLVLVDGNADPGLAVETRTLVKGDARSINVAAASILAKVARDRRLLELDARYPQYQFARHKGYPTRLHYQMLDEYGPSPVHRSSFLKKWRAGRG